MPAVSASRFSGLRLRSLLAPLLLAVGVLPAAAQTTLSTNIGASSSQQTVTLTFGASGRVASMTFLTEGKASTEFQLSGTSSTCAVNTSYAQNNTCTVNYTFQPQRPGNRKGAVVLSDANGNRLATGYISGRGVGPLGVYYPAMPIPTSYEQQLLGVSYQQSFDRDENGNFYFIQITNGGGADAVIKESPNGDGTYTSRAIAYEDINTLPGGGVAVDSSGTVFYTNSYNSGQGSCYIYQLTPTNNGYTKTVMWSGPSGGICMNYLKADVAGSLYVIDTSGNVLKFVYNGTGWNSFKIGTVFLSNATTFHQVEVDSSGNVFVAAGGSQNLAGNAPFVEFAYNAANPGVYTRINNPGLTIDGTQTGAAYGVAVGPDDSLYISQDSRVIRAAPTGTTGSYNTTPFFTARSSGGPQALKVDSLGNLYIDYVGSVNSGIIVTVPSVLSTNFGTVNSGSASSPQHFTLLNTGTASLNLTAAAAAAPFGLFADTPASVDCGAGTSLTPGATCELSMFFGPPANVGGPFTGAAYVYDNNLNGTTVYQPLALTGTANHPPPTIASYTPTSGDSTGGTTFVITGTALSDVSKVVFTAPDGSSVYASFTVNSATQLTVTAPNLGASGRSVTFTVTNPGGTASGTWTYNAPASAANSTLSLAQSPVGQGSSVTVVATVQDANGNPLNNATVVLNSSNVTVLSGATQTTNSSGSAQFTLQALTPGTTQLSASVLSVALSQKPVLTVTAPVVAVGQSVSSLPSTVVFTSAGTLAAVSVVTNGKSGADFTLAGGSCTTGTTYAAGATCTVNYNFAPSAPGLRFGAVLLKDSSGNVLGQNFISAMATGPLALLSPGVQTTVTTDGTNGTRDAVYDGYGNLFTATANGLIEVSPSGSRTTIDYHYIIGLTLDGAGNLFYADSTHVYELLNATGTPVVVATYAQGAGPAGPMAVDATGNIYVPLFGGTIGKLAAGSFAASTVTSVSGASPIAVALDSSNNLFFADSASNSIYRVPAGSSTATAVVTGVASPRGLAIDAAGNLYVSGSGSITRYATGTYAATYVAGSNPTGLHIDGQGTLTAATGRTVYTLNRTSSPGFTFSTTVGTATGQQFVSYENDGNANLLLNAASVSPTAFALGSGTTCTFPSTLTPTSSPCTVSVLFNPSTPGTYTGSLAVKDNSLNLSGATQGVTLTGSAFGTQTITFTAPVSPVLAGTTATLSATASSGLPVTFTVASGLAEITGNQITYTGSGAVTITASQPGNATYTAAASVSQSVLVSGTAAGVGSSNGGKLSATLTFTAAGTLAQISVLTQGAPNEDFTYATGSTDPKACVIGNTYAAAATCTVTYYFNPTRPGMRLGAVTLFASGNAALASTTVSGTGVGPLALFPDSNSSTVFTGSTFNQPQSVAVDGFGNLIVADTNNGLVKRINATSGTLSSSSSVDVLTYVSPSTGSGVLNPAGVAVAGNGDIFYAQAGDGSQGGGMVQKYTAVNGVVPAGSTPVTVAGGFYYPQSLLFDASGNLLVGDLLNYKVKQIVAVNGVIPASPTVRTLVSDTPYGIALDAIGNLYVASANSISVYTATNGAVNSNSPVSYLTLSDGGPNFQPYGVAIDANGNLFASDPQLGVRELLAVNGVLSNSSSLVKFTGMQGRGLALDGFGHVFTADTANNAVRMNDLTRPNNLSFPSTYVTVTSAAMPTRIENGGNAPLAFTGITAMTNFGIDSATTSCSTTSPLSAASLCTVGTVFAPQTKGLHAGSVALSENSLNTASTQNILLMGTGIAGTTAQTINFPQPATPVVNGAAPITLTATATSGLPVSLTVSGPATLTGNLLSFTGAGSVTVIAAQGGNSTFAAAPSVPIFITVTAAPSNFVALETAVGTTQPGIATLTFTTAATLPSNLATAIQVTTQGISGLDFTYAAGGTCAAGASYTVGQACTVAYTFTPTAAGLRLGAIVLQSSNSTPVQAAVSFLSGIGDAPLSLFTTGSETTIASLNTPRSPFVDAAGNIFVTQQGAGTLVELPVGTTTPLTLASGVTGITGTTVDGAGDIFYGSPADNTIYQLVNGSPVAIASIPNPDDNLVADAAGNLYVTSANAGLYKIAANTHTVTTVLAAGATVPGGVLGRTIGLAIDRNGLLYLADYANARLLSVNPSTAAVTTLATGGPWLSNPHGVAVDAAGNIYIVNNDGSNFIVKFTLANGSYTPSLLATSAAAQGIFAASNGDLLVVNGSVLGRYSRQSGPVISFPSTPINASSAAKSVGLENDGDAALSFTAASVSANFSMGANSCAPGTTVIIGGSCLLSLSFSPTTVGPLTGTATLTSNSSGIAGSLQIVTLSGTATQTSQTIAFSPASPLTYAVGLTSTLSAVASSGLPVTFSVVSGPGAISGNVLTITGAGTVVVQASQAGNSDYLAATSVQSSISIQPGPQTLSFALPVTEAVYTASGLSYSLGATSSTGLPVSYTVAGPATITGTTLSITGPGTVVITATQPGNANFTAAGSRTLLFTADAPTDNALLPSGSTGNARTVTVAVPSGFTLRSFNTALAPAGSGSINVLNGSGAGACTIGATYSVGATCTVTVVVTPSSPGLLSGTVGLVGDGGTVAVTVPVVALRYR